MGWDIELRDKKLEGRGEESFSSLLFKGEFYGVLMSIFITIESDGTL